MSEFDESEGRTPVEPPHGHRNTLEANLRMVLASVTQINVRISEMEHRWALEMQNLRDMLTELSDTVRRIELQVDKIP